MSAPREFEFERRLSVVDLDPNAPRSVSIEANAAERAALAERLRVEAIESLESEITLRREITGDVIARGSIAADVVQACVVTLAPVPARIETVFEQRYTARTDDGEADDEDPVEAIDDGEIEVGDIVAQNLSLALDPYPRAPGARFEEFDDEEGERRGPFAALSRLRSNDDETGGDR